MKPTAVVVTYLPPPDFSDHLDTWVSQVDKLVVVDNGSPSQWQQEFSRLIRSKYNTVEFISNEENLGIAASLNQGFARLIEEGHGSAFVFDQDSVPAPGMIAEILDVYTDCLGRGRVAIVAPQVEIPSAKAVASFLIPQGRFLFRRVRCDDRKALEHVSIVISSGALYDLDAYQQIGRFRDDFFIDYVDTEYCLRAQQQGYEVVVACRALLRHELGNQQERRFGPLTMHPTFHSPLRWYFISRNRIQVMLQYALRFPHWLLYELVVNTYGLVRLVLFEDRKIAKMRAILLGTWDGLAKRMGPISPARQSVLAATGEQK